MDFSGYKILVVEDSDEFRWMMSEILKREGFRVAFAINGREALERLHGGEIPDLIFTDMAMPVMGGREFIEELRKDQELAAIPIVIVSNDAYLNKITKELGVLAISKMEFKSVLPVIQMALANRHDGSAREKRESRARRATEDARVKINARLRDQGRPELSAQVWDQITGILATYKKGMTPEVGSHALIELVMAFERALGSR